MNPNDSQLSNQFEEWSVKGCIQTLGLGLTEVLKRNINVFEVGLIPDEFCTWYKEPLVKMGIVDGSAKEKALQQIRSVLDLQENDMVLGQYKVIFECLFVTHY